MIKKFFLVLSLLMVYSIEYTASHSSDESSYPIHPILDCKINYGNNTCISFWGYHNMNTHQKAVPVSNNNKFLPGISDRGQLHRFEPGEYHYVFSVLRNCSEEPLLTWKLCYNGCRTATSDLDSNCPKGCDNIYFSNSVYDLCGICGGDNSTCNQTTDSFSTTSSTDTSTTRLTNEPTSSTTTGGTSESDSFPCSANNCSSLYIGNPVNGEGKYIYIL